jgi:cellulose synthase/poly-beta-1,6-N-acetylglucosamine synthase-like glycosyltransferase
MTVTAPSPAQNLAPTHLDPALPAPPNDAEKYWYLGRQHRWLLGLQAVSFSLIAWSVLRFSTADIRLILFLVPMTLYAITLVVSLLSGTHRRRVTRSSHDEKVASWRPDTHPAVDVFLPTAGEPLDVLENTYSYVSRLSWPGEKTVWVLDDSARPEVAALAEKYGLTYRTRPNRGEFKKAGNLRFGFEQSTGDLILVLDADFVPRPDMLTELAPYFDDPQVGIVQSPQFFDTRQPGLGWLQRCAGSTQELFYRFIQPSRDRVNAAICVGTCALYRRAALAAAGGFAQIGHSEDVHTGVKLTKLGYCVRYVPILVSKGLCPDNGAAFLNQQYRWCTGSMSLLVDRSFHEAARITRSQKLCYWAGFLYYISTAVNSVVAPLPAIAMLWLLPAWVEPMNSVWLAGAFLLWFVVLPLTMRGHWRFSVLRVQHLYSFAHLTAIVHIRSGRTREWVATGASGGTTTPLAVTIGRTVKGYVVVTQLLVWAGLLRGTLEYGIGAYWAMLVLGLMGAYIQVPLLFLRTKPRKVRAPKRVVAPHVMKRARSIRTAGGIPAQRRPSGPVLPPKATPVFSAVPVVEPGSAPGPRRFRPDIQGMRAIAELLVVLYHANVPHVSAGYVGVDVFFVISGFLITGQLLREVDRTGRISLLKFYGGRIRRLLPPAIIVVVGTLLAARLWDSIFHVSRWRSTRSSRWATG